MSDHLDARMEEQIKELQNLPGFHDREWVQKGNQLVERNGQTGITIPAGKMLIKKEGKYHLVDDRTYQNKREPAAKV